MPLPPLFRPRTPFRTPTPGNSAMNKFSCLKKSAVWLLAMSLLLIPLRPSWAFLDQFAGGLSVEKEKQIGEEFLMQIQQVVPLVEDPFITSYINRLGQRLVTQLGPQPFKYRFFIIDDPSMNAFAVPGGYVFVTTGMIRQTEREGELAGVMAHEISHVYARHMSKTLEKARITNIATLIGGLASIFLGGALAQPLLMGSMAAGASAMLKYSRDFEREADSLGFRWMVKAGYDPRDMITIFRKLGKQRWFEGGELPIYLSTHPDVDSRIVELSNQLSQYQGRLPHDWNSPDYQYFALRVAASCGNPHQLLRRMTQDSLHDSKNPAFHYGKALALAKLEQENDAIKEFNEALKLSPANLLIQRDLAVYYFNHNQYLQAQGLLEELSQRSPQDDVTLYYLGRIYQERKQVDRALPLFEKVHQLNPTFSEVYLNLGTLYGEKGQIGLAHYYLGYYSLKAKAYPTALFHFRKALKNLSPADLRYSEVTRQVVRLERLRVRVSN
jgi:predicted Zn-dependent protease